MTDEVVVPEKPTAADVQVARIERMKSDQLEREAVRALVAGDLARAHVFVSLATLADLRNTRSLLRDVLVTLQKRDRF